jgi:hypothetical protein
MATSAPRFDGVADWPLDDKIKSFEKDGLIFKFRRIAPHVDEWTTRITRIAYTRGFEVGLKNHDTACCRNPYREHDKPNFMKGRNDPWHAWNAGYADGWRLRRMFDKPEACFDLQQREWRLLPPSLQRRMRTHAAIVDMREAGGDR